MRIGLGSRLIRKPAHAAVSLERDRKLSIGDLLQITAVVAITFGIGRLGVPAGAENGAQFAMWAPFIIMGAIASLIGLVTLVPLLWIFSRAKSLAHAWLFAMVFPLMIEAILLSYLASGAPIPFGLQGFVALTLVFFTYFGSIAGGLSLLRGNDIRWQGKP